MKTLKELKVGETGTIKKMHVSGALKQRFMDMGLTKGEEVKIVKIAPLGDPIEMIVRGYNVSIRKADAENIEMA